LEGEGLWQGASVACSTKAVCNVAEEEQDALLHVWGEAGSDGW
jgi:hypothetical protein